MGLSQIILYGAATFVAIRVLVGLMEHHRRVYRGELARREREREGALAAESAPASPEPAAGERRAA